VGALACRSLGGLFEFLDWLSQSYMATTSHGTTFWGFAAELKQSNLEGALFKTAVCDSGAAGSLGPGSERRLSFPVPTAQRCVESSDRSAIAATPVV